MPEQQDIRVIKSGESTQQYLQRVANATNSRTYDPATGKSYQPQGGGTSSIPSTTTSTAAQPVSEKTAKIEQLNQREARVTQVQDKLTGQWGRPEDIPPGRRGAVRSSLGYYSPQPQPQQQLNTVQQAMLGVSGGQEQPVSKPAPRDIATVEGVRQQSIAESAYGATRTGYSIIGGVVGKLKSGEPAFFRMQDLTGTQSTTTTATSESFQVGAGPPGAFTMGPGGMGLFSRSSRAAVESVGSFQVKELEVTEHGTPWSFQRFENTGKYLAQGAVGVGTGSAYLVGLSATGQGGKAGGVFIGSTASMLALPMRFATKPGEYFPEAIRLGGAALLFKAGAATQKTTYKIVGIKGFRFVVKTQFSEAGVKQIKALKVSKEEFVTEKPWIYPQRVEGGYRGLHVGEVLTEDQARVSMVGKSMGKVRVELGETKNFQETTIWREEPGKTFFKQAQGKVALPGATYAVREPPNIGTATLEKGLRKNQLDFSKPVVTGKAVRGTQVSVYDIKFNQPVFELPGRRPLTGGRDPGLRFKQLAASRGGRGLLYAMKEGQAIPIPKGITSVREMPKAAERLKPLASLTGIKSEVKQIRRDISSQRIRQAPKSFITARQGIRQVSREKSAGVQEARVSFKPSFNRLVGSTNALIQGPRVIQGVSSKVSQARLMQTSQITQTTARFKPSMPSIKIPQPPTIPFKASSRTQFSNQRRGFSILRRDFKRRREGGFSLIPLADLLSKTQTEFALGRPATQPAVTRKNVRAYRKMIESGRMRFPTEEMLKGKVKI